MRTDANDNFWSSKISLNSVKSSKAATQLKYKEEFR